MEDFYLILTPREAKLREHARLAENRDFLEREDRKCPRCRMGWLMNGLAYAVLAVIQRLVRMSLATTARMETAINVSMHEN